MDSNRVRIGAEVLLRQSLNLLKNRQIGVVCNQASALPNGTHLIDTLISLNLSITAIFGPEHGIGGTGEAGKAVSDEKDARTGIPVFSLYGKTRKPTPEMLHDVDVLIFDIPDVGARFFTYASTMAYCMEAAAENHKKILILDRPNPINGVDVEGPVLDTAFKSFIGMFPIPIRHGMTMGELALMIVGEGWINQSKDIDLQVIPMEHWDRAEWLDDTELTWIPPSPNMKTLATATVYPGTCLIEATNVTEGRGTEKPFECIGAPWIDSKTLATEMNARGLGGVTFEPITFTPRADTLSASSPKFKNEECGGVFLHVTDRKKFKPVRSALLLLEEIQKLYQHHFTIRKDNFKRLAGINLLDDEGRLSSNIDFDGIERETAHFLSLRSKYLLY